MGVRNGHRHALASVIHANIQQMRQERRKSSRAKAMKFSTMQRQDDMHQIPYLLVVGYCLFVAEPLLQGASAAQAGLETQAGVGTAVEAEQLGFEDAELADYRLYLLENAFEIASAIPLNPHIKDRAKAQEAVVATCLELNQPVRALRYTEEIPNWRRGACYADLGHYLAQQGKTDLAVRYLDEAYEVVENTWGDDSQDWHRDRIRAKIARTYFFLGRLEEANLFGGELVDSEAYQYQVYRSEIAELGDAEYTAALAGLEQSSTAGSFDATRTAAQICIRHYDRFFADDARKMELEQELAAGWQKLPIVMRLELMLEMGHIATKYQDGSTALRIAADGKKLIGEFTWRTEDEIAMRGKYAQLAFLAGDTTQARADIDHTLGYFERQRNQIENAYRADSLRPLGEAYHAIGDANGATMAYRRALDEGLENPNFRPRAEDFVATTCSMARVGFKPDEDLLDLVRRARESILMPR